MIYFISDSVRPHHFLSPRLFVCFLAGQSMHYLLSKIIIYGSSDYYLVSHIRGIEEFGVIN